MARLYVFGIGGTGARVIKSLVMLNASGLDMNGYELVPILIDPDQGNADVNRTVTLLQTYQRLRNKLEFKFNQFFKTNITSLPEGFRFAIKDSQDSFQDFIGYEQLSSTNKALINLLYTNENLAGKMNVGFKGNPNIGSVVLNQFKTLEEFDSFATAFQANDRIFIISSIFGGTGAAGFPLLLNNIREANASIPNHKLLIDSVIGALTVLPYFTLQTDKEGIDADSFVSKSIAALSYYNRSINGDKNNNISPSLNMLYYIGDPDTVIYENHDGGSKQKDPAHFIEVAGALAVIDFAWQAQDMVTGPINTTIYKEFGVADSILDMTFDGLGPSTQNKLKKSLSQFKFMSQYLNLELDESLGVQPAFTTGTRIEKQFKSMRFYSDLVAFDKMFNDWLDELANSQTFKPFRNNTNSTNLFELLNGIEPNSPGIMNIIRRTENFNYFNSILQEAASGPVANLPIEEKFGAAFYLATETIMKNRFNC